jgi:hypothetical protein
MIGRDQRITHFCNHEDQKVLFFNLQRLDSLLICQDLAYGFSLRIGLST